MQHLHMVSVALILFHIIYALPAWGEHFTRQLQECLNVFLKRARKFGFCDANYTTTELLVKAHARIFRLVQRPEHGPYHLLPDTIDSCSMELRHRGHSFPLPHCKQNLYQNTISRCLFKCI